MTEDPVLVAKWDALLPGRRYQADGSETTFSRIARMAAADVLEREAEGKDPRLAESNATRRARNAAEARKAESEARDAAFWNDTPKALRKMGLGEGHVATIGGLEMDWPGMLVVEEWRKSGQLFLTLGGPPGSGKTLAACRLLLEEGREWVPCESHEAFQWRPSWARFARAADLARFSYFEKSDRGYLTVLENARFLILDDLGAELASTTWLATFLELLDKRMAGGRRTVITTNLTYVTFGERYDARVMRRLKEHGRFALVPRRAEAA